MARLAPLVDELHRVEQDVHTLVEVRPADEENPILHEAARWGRREQLAVDPGWNERNRHGVTEPRFDRFPDVSAHRHDPARRGPRREALIPNDALTEPLLRPRRVLRNDEWHAVSAAEVASSRTLRIDEVSVDKVKWKSRAEAVKRSADGMRVRARLEGARGMTGAGGEARPDDLDAISHLALRDPAEARVLVQRPER